MSAGTQDTIFALATGAGRAAIAVVRVSGPAAAAVARALAGRLPPPRHASYARLRDPASGDTLDRALVLFFEGARSQTGEDGVEFHCHGGPAVVAAVLGALARQPGLRPAEPGEFARRAFGNGRMDLAQLEGLADLIDAETEWQRRQAQRQMSGVLRDATAPWRAALIEAAAEVETAIDFAEDVATDAGLHDAVCARLAPVRAGLAAELARGTAAERVRDGVQVVIAGPPNAGKSTLLNALVRREAAIVSAVAGTTRDPIEVHLDLGGCPVTLIDTAGLRDTDEAVERIGVRRALDRAEAADLVLWLGAGTPPALPCPLWRLAPKSDLHATAPQERDPVDAAVPEDAPMPLSARTGHNMDRLLRRLAGFAQTLAGGGGVIARARHRAAFAAAAAALDRAAAPALPPELLAEELRAARHALDRLIGAVDVEDILGDVFSRYCIGK